MIREYIIETCKKYGIEDYTINSDLSIDVNDDVDLSHKGLTELPLTFNIVDGYFFCNNNKLTTLRGAPRECVKFYCYNNKLTSLEGAPNECEYFSCWGNNLTSLKGSPKCDRVSFDYENLRLDNEAIYVIEALFNYYKYKELNNYLKIRKRDEFINSILD